MSLVNQIDQVLPQTQCGECDYAGCKPYARAITKGEAINKCPPGGTEVLIKLAHLTGQDAGPYLAEMQKKQRPPSVAVIREEECIGCTKCIQACPVDAILGAGKLMHTVIGTECTGCELCIEPCPVDCIDMVELKQKNYDPLIARERYEFRNFRLNRDKEERTQQYKNAKNFKNNIEWEKIVEARKSEIQNILARVKSKK